MEHNKKKMELFSNALRSGGVSGDHNSETQELIDQNKHLNSSLGVADSIIQ